MITSDHRPVRSGRAVFAADHGTSLSPVTNVGGGIWRKSKSEKPLAEKSEIRRGGTQHLENKKENSPGTARRSRCRKLAETSGNSGRAAPRRCRRSAGSSCGATAGSYAAAAVDRRLFSTSPVPDYSPPSPGYPPRPRIEGRLSMMSTRACGRRCQVDPDRAVSVDRLIGDEADRRKPENAKTTVGNTGNSIWARKHGTFERLAATVGNCRKLPEIRVGLHPVSAANRHALANLLFFPSMVLLYSLSARPVLRDSLSKGDGHLAKPLRHRGKCLRKLRKPLLGREMIAPQAGRTPRRPEKERRAFATIIIARSRRTCAKPSGAVRRASDKLRTSPSAGR
jgi:hypothetical protein